MERSFGLFFYVRKSKSDKISERSVYMRITTTTESVDVGTKRKIDLLKWNIAAGRMLKNYKDSGSFNDYLDTMQQKVFEAKRKLLELDKPVTAQNIKDLLFGREIHVEKKMLMEIFQYHNDQMEKLVGKEFSPATPERYKTSYRHTQSFMESRYKIADMDILKLDYEFISEYEFWLKKLQHREALPVCFNHSSFS